MEASLWASQGPGTHIYARHPYSAYEREANEVKSHDPAAPSERDRLLKIDARRTVKEIEAWKWFLTGRLGWTTARRTFMAAMENVGQNT